MKKKKNNLGVTLIALAVTIIVRNDKNNPMQ